MISNYKAFTLLLVQLCVWKASRSIFSSNTPVMSNDKQKNLVCINCAGWGGAAHWSFNCIEIPNHGSKGQESGSCSN